MRFIGIPLAAFNVNSGRRILTALFAPLAFVALLGGCVQAGEASELHGAESRASVSVEPRIIGDWAEPGWMAQVRQEMEEYQIGQLACFAEHGMQGAVTSSGLVIRCVSENEDDSRTQLEHGWAVIRECDERFPIPSIWVSRDEAAYERLLDVRECIIVHGADVSEPPSLQTWLEMDYPVWNPFDYVLDSGGSMDIHYLLRNCPQGSFGIVAMVEAEDCG